MFTDETGIGPIESVKMGENARERERERERETEKMKIGGRKALVGPTMPFLKCTDISSVRERTRHLGIFSSLSQRFFRSTFSFIYKYCYSIGSRGRILSFHPEGCLQFHCLICF